MGEGSESSVALLHLDPRPYGLQGGWPPGDGNEACGRVHKTGGGASLVRSLRAAGGSDLPGPPSAAVHDSAFTVQEEG